MLLFHVEKHLIYIEKKKAILKKIKRTMNTNTKKAILKCIFSITMVYL